MIQTQVLIALIAAISALFVAVITGIAQLLQLRAKQKLEATSKYDEQLSEQERARFEEIRKALREACKALQGVQDEIF